MRKLLASLLCVLAWFPAGAGEVSVLPFPKDKMGQPVLAGSRLVASSESYGKTFAPGQRNLKPVLTRFERTPSGDLLLRLPGGRRKEDPEEWLFPVVKETQDTLYALLFPVFSTYPEALSAIPPKMLPGRAQSYELLSARCLPEYLEVTGRYRYRSGLDLTANCYFIFLKDRPMPSRTLIGYSRVEGPRKVEQPSLRWDLGSGRKLQFYVDRAFPEDWYPYIKEGIEDWNKAFEAIGLGAVLEVLPEPEGLDRNGPLTNMVRYLDVEESNAKGDVLFDPRSGEILQGDILWWKNVVDLLQGWRYVQTGAADPAARQLDYPMEMMGPMIRHAICHEMGHVLGLNHNMGASWSYPADSLRSPGFTRRYGTSASVMDYARYNHLATAADVARGVSLLPPRIGPYDMYAIALGYGEEEPEPGPYCYYAPFISSAISPDPSSQAHTLGNDLLRSSRAGVDNCRALLELDGLTPERTSLLSKNYYNYLWLALSNIGGAVEGVPVPRKTCDRTLSFVMEALAKVPSELRSGKEEQRILDELVGNYLPQRVAEQYGNTKHYYRKMRILARRYRGLPLKDSSEWKTIITNP